MKKSNNHDIQIPCLKVKQPIGEFYIGVINHKDLIHISYADIRRLETGSEMREVEIYTGIQRELSKTRVNEIEKYVNMIDATFPTSVILHVQQKDTYFDQDHGILFIPNKKNSVKVLDGQHRIAGLEKYEGDNSFQINVTIFIEMELEDQAIVFATINKTQTKVNKSLVADLFAFAKYRSPQKTVHNIIRALNQKEGSPFKDKIKILGTAINKEKETITQATFSESLIKYISKDPMIDRNVYKKGQVPERVDSKELKNRPLRNLFIDEDDNKIAKLIWNYFNAIQKKWPKAWIEVKPEIILNKSTGFVALMRFFKDAYLYFDKIGSVIEIEEFFQIFEKIELIDSDFNRDRYIPGSTGRTKLYNDLLELSGISTN